MTLSRFEALRKNCWTLYFVSKKSRFILTQWYIKTGPTHTRARSSSSQMARIPFGELYPQVLENKRKLAPSQRPWIFNHGPLKRGSRATHIPGIFWLLHPSGACFSSDIVRKWERPSNTVFAMGKSERCFRRIGSQRGLGRISHTLPEIKLFYCLEREKSESVKELREKAHVTPFLWTVKESG